MSKLGKKLLKAAEEANAIARGEADPATYRVFVPADVDAAKIRRGLKMSQNEFARRFGIPPGTLRDWEQGRRKPEGPARAYLMVIERNPDAVRKALTADA